MVLDRIVTPAERATVHSYFQDRYGIAVSDYVSSGLGTPQGVAASTVSASELDVTWSAVTGATGYDIERDGAVVQYDHPASPFHDAGLDAATSYDYRVRAVVSG